MGYEQAARGRCRMTWGERYSPSSVIALAAFILAVAGAVYATAAPIQRDDVRVIDADTVRLHNQRPDVRLVGFNAPETRRANCPAERELGNQAARRVRELIRTGTLDFTYVACACRPGTAGTNACNFGRRCGTLKVNGRDLGDILTAEKLAVPFQCSETRCPPTPRPWCE
jgi:endonuclease YncB( thermonuclease family)